MFGIATQSSNIAEKTDVSTDGGEGDPGDVEQRNTFQPLRGITR